jgi:hypothetical protein
VTDSRGSETDGVESKGRLDCISGWADPARSDALDVFDKDGFGFGVV